MRQTKKENKDNEYVEIRQPAAKSWFNMVYIIRFRHFDSGHSGSILSRQMHDAN